MLATVTSIVGLFTCVHLAVGAAIGAGAGIGGQSFAPPIPQPPAPPCGSVSAAAPCPPCAQGAAQKGPAMYSPPIWRPPPPVTAEDDVHCAARFADNLAGRSFQEELCAPEFDVVYTWVNGSDPRLQAELREWKGRLGLVANVTASEGNQSDSKGGSNRYRDNQELRYSLRSLWQFSPWIRKVFIVTNYQVPYWLNIDHPKVEVITHAMIFSNKSHLPVFSSPSIESHLHRIPGLSKKFIYFNDDVMLGSEVWPSDFYTHMKGQKVYLSWDIPQCAPGCPEAWLADKYCDSACNTSLCHWDEGDCRVVNGSRSTSWKDSSQAVDDKSFEQPPPSTPAPAQVSKPKCHRFCPDSWVGDKVCDNSCNRVECAFDAGDCGAGEISTSVFGIDLNAASQTDFVRIPRLASSFYVNLTGYFEYVLDASHDNQDFVRTAIITQELQILVFLLHDRPADADWDEIIEIYLEGGWEGQDRNTTFLVARDDSGVGEGTVQLSTAPTAAPVAAGAAASRTLLWVPASDDPSRYEPSADLFDAVRNVRSVPDGKGGTVPIDRMGPAEKALAKRIGDDKAKELAINLIEEARREVQKRWERGTERMLWPSELSTRVSAEIERVLEEEVMGPARAGERRLLEDTFGNSLKFVNSLYRARYGSEQRKAPAHMPHMIDRDIMAELQAAFPKEFEATSAHRFRDSEDMQFSFSYFYFLMNEKLEFVLEDFFAKTLDLNGDGTLDALEIRHIALLFMTGKPNIEAMNTKITQIYKDLLGDMVGAVAAHRALGTEMAEDWAAGVAETLTEGSEDGTTGEELGGDELGEEEGDRVGETANASNTAAVGDPDRWRDFVVPEIGLETVRQSTRIVEDLRQYVRKQKKYRHETMNLNEVEFFMVPDDYAEVQERLDHIIVKSPKFICLNDDMNKTHDPPAETLAALMGFYNTYYPYPSPFENPPDRPNPFLHYEQLVEYKQQQRALRGESIESPTAAPTTMPTMTPTATVTASPTASPTVAPTVGQAPNPPLDPRKEKPVSAPSKDETNVQQGRTPQSSQSIGSGPAAQSGVALEATARAASAPPHFGVSLLITGALLAVMALFFWFGTQTVAAAD